MCTHVMENYSVRYQLRNSNGNYTTVQSSTTSVTLQGLTANAEYIVSVAALTSAGGMSSFTEATQFELLGDFCVQLLFPVYHIVTLTPTVFFMLLFLQSPNLLQV